MQNRQNERFEEADFTGARFHSVFLKDVKITDAMLLDVEISGLVGGLRVNGVDVGPLVEAELNRRHPERLLLSPRDGDGTRAAWNAVEEWSAATVERAWALPEQKLNESVDGEWSYLETLRHLVYATDRWITGPVLNEPDPFHQLGMPNHPHDEVDTSLFRLDARPTFEEVLAVRRERMDRVAKFVSDANIDDLSRQIASPNGGTTSVMSCIHVVLGEEWAHNQYANRDLDILESHG